MSRQTFSLTPFPFPNTPSLTISGNIARQNNVLALHFVLVGDIREVILPPPSAPPGRKNELWETTCFEFFLAIEGQPQYWEFNASPSGDWNVYHMDAYRRIGFRKETSIQRLQLEARKEARTFTLDTAVDLTPILPASQSLEVGITAVIQTKDGSETYWALAHPGSQPDFHRRESFTLALAGQTRLSPRSAPGS